MKISIRLADYVEEDHRIYKVHFFGSVVTTTVTSDPGVISDWIVTIANFLNRFQTPVVGMGVQWLPHGKYFPAAILQLNVGKRCLIIQLLYCRYVPQTLRDFLMDDCYTFVGIWNHSDARRLEESNGNLKLLDPPLDLREHVRTDEGKSLRSASFEEIVEECLGYYGVSLDREISMSNWEDRYLSLEQVRQATVDAHASFMIGRNYRAWRFR